MKISNALRGIAFAVLVQTMTLGCQANSTSEAAARAVLPIQLAAPLGTDLKLLGLDVTTRPDRRSWIITLHATALRAANPGPRLWVHAYPQGSSDYFPLDPIGPVQPAIIGRPLRDQFLLPRAGAFNLYAGVTAADGSPGPAVGLGWVGVGDPDTAEYHTAYRFLQEADDARAAAMLKQTQSVYPSARLP